MVDDEDDEVIAARREVAKETLADISEAIWQAFIKQEVVLATAGGSDEQRREDTESA